MHYSLLLARNKGVYVELIEPPASPESPVPFILGLIGNTNINLQAHSGQIYVPTDPSIQLYTSV